MSMLAWLAFGVAVWCGAAVALVWVVSRMPPKRVTRWERERDNGAT